MLCWAERQAARREVQSLGSVGRSVPRLYLKT
jgi:hypothetical protein